MAKEKKNIVRDLNYFNNTRNQYDITNQKIA